MHTTIYLGPAVPASVERNIRRRVEHMLDHEPNFCGDEIAIERGEYTYVDGATEINGAVLLTVADSEMERYQASA